MKESIDKIKIMIVQYLEVDGDSMSEAKILAIPCRSESAVKEFEEFYRKKFPPTQLMNISIIDSHIYG